MQNYDTERFHAERLTGIGGSEVAAILGLPGAFNTALEIWTQKTERLPPKDLSGEPRVFFGTHAEGPLAKWYERERGVPVRLHDPDFLRHPTEPLLICHPDGFAENGGRRLLEMKAVANDQRKKWAEGPPLIYQVQLQHNLGIALEAGVVDDEVAEFVVLTGGCDPETHETAFDPAFWSHWKEFARAWWDRHIVHGEMPAITADDLEVVKDLFPATKAGVVVDLDAGFLDKHMALLDAKAEEKRAKEERDQLEAEFRAAIGEAEVGRLPSGVRYTLKTVNRRAYQVAESSYRQLRLVK